MNGLGYFKHKSGYSYDGIFENGIPAKLATKLELTVDESNFDPTKKRFDVFEGATSLFSVTVKSVNNNGEVFEEDGRNIQLLLAIKVELSDKNRYEKQIVTEL